MSLKSSCFAFTDRPSHHHNLQIIPGPVPSHGRSRRVMASLRAADLALVATLFAFCCGVNGFTAPIAVGITTTFTSSTSTSSPIQLASLARTQTQRRSRHDPLALRAVGGEEDGIEEYKKQMAEFMAQAHEKRLQAMEAVKAEVQRGYEEQIADLQSKASLHRSSDRDSISI